MVFDSLKTKICIVGLASLAMLPVDVFLYNRLGRENPPLNVGVVETNSTTNYTEPSRVETEEQDIAVSLQERLEKANLERAVKEAFEKRVVAPVPQERTIKYDDLKDCSAKLETPNIKESQKITLNKNSGENIPKIINKYIGKPYGPTKKNGGREMYDCITLVQAVAKDLGRNIPENRGDKIYARHTDPITILSLKEFNLRGVRPGDLVFIGDKYSPGERGMSAEHLGIIEEIKYDSLGNPLDATMVHASGSYSKGRKSYHGRGVVRESLMSYMDKCKNHGKKNRAFIGRLNV